MSRRLIWEDQIDGLSVRVGVTDMYFAEPEMDAFDWLSRISPPTAMIAPSLNMPGSPVRCVTSLLITILNGKAAVSCPVSSIRKSNCQLVFFSPSQFLGTVGSQTEAFHCWFMQIG